MNDMRTDAMMFFGRISLSGKKQLHGEIITFVSKITFIDEAHGLVAQQDRAAFRRKKTALSIYRCMVA